MYMYILNSSAIVKKMQDLCYKKWIENGFNVLYKHVCTLSGANLSL